jgi:hypothetical protein
MKPYTGQGPKSKYREMSNARLRAWLRIISAMAEMREALDYRIFLENSDELSLEEDVRSWCRLAAALTDLLTIGRPSDDN